VQIEKLSSTVFTPLADGTGVLLNLDTLFYYSLNRTGAAVWEQIEQRKKVSLEDVVRTICDRFEVDGEAARSRVGEFLTKLQEFKLIKVS
jgi:hypothetical protein